MSVRVVPANEASWDDITAILGTSYPGRCRCQWFKVSHPTLRRVVMRVDFT